MSLFVNRLLCSRLIYVHAVFHVVPPLELHNLYVGKHDKGDQSYKFILQVANFHR